MYLLQAAALPEGSQDPSEAAPWRDVLQDFSQRSVAISPAAEGQQAASAARELAPRGAEKRAALPPGPYCFRVRARSSAGWGEWSEQVFRRVAKASDARRRHASGRRSGAGGVGDAALLSDADVWAAPCTTVLSSEPISTSLPVPDDDDEEEADEGEEDAGLGDVLCVDGRAEHHDDEGAAAKTKAADAGRVAAVSETPVAAFEAEVRASALSCCSWLFAVGMAFSCAVTGVWGRTCVLVCTDTCIRVHSRTGGDAVLCCVACQGEDAVGQTQRAVERGESRQCARVSDAFMSKFVRACMHTCTCAVCMHHSPATQASCCGAPSPQKTQDSNAQQVMVLASSGQLLRTEHLPCPAVALCFSVDGGLYVGSGLDFFAKLDQSLNQLWKVSE